MTLLRVSLMLAGAVALSACSSFGDVTRAGGGVDALLGAPMQSDVPMPVEQSYTVTEVNVTVPETLTVSEANGFKPRVDIVWREDPLGDRYAQVAKIVKDALIEGTAGLRGDRKVRLDVVVTRFHALTQRTRYTIGGTHDVRMVLAVRDAKTGELLEPERQVGFEIHAAGGDEALREEAEGLTQKVVISNALEEMIQRELTQAGAAAQG